MSRNATVCAILLLRCPTHLHRRSFLVERLALVSHRGHEDRRPHRRPLHTLENQRGPPSRSLRACRLQTPLSRRLEPLLVRNSLTLLSPLTLLLAKSTSAANSGYAPFVSPAMLSLPTTRTFPVQTSPQSSCPNTPPSSIRSHVPHRFPPYSCSSSIPAWTRMTSRLSETPWSSASVCSLLTLWSA